MFGINTPYTNKTLGKLKPVKNHLHHYVLYRLPTFILMQSKAFFSMVLDTERQIKKKYKNLPPSLWNFNGTFWELRWHFPLETWNSKTSEHCMCAIFYVLNVEDFHQYQHTECISQQVQYCPYRLSLMGCKMQCLSALDLHQINKCQQCLNNEIFLKI